MAKGRKLSQEPDKSLPKLFSNAWWNMAYGDFAFKAEDVRHPVLESERDALARVEATGADDGYHPETGSLLLGIPYLRGIPRDYLEYIIEICEERRPELEVLFARREASAEFIQALMRFNFAYGFLAAVVMYQGDDLGPERAKLRGTEVKQAKALLKKRWISVLLQRELEIGVPRKVAEMNVANKISDFITQLKSQNADVTWHEELLDKERNLKSAFRQNNLSAAEVKDLAKRGEEGLPAMPIVSPKT